MSDFAGWLVLLAIAAVGSFGLGAQWALRGRDD
jgi:hypothetical protein